MPFFKENRRACQISCMVVSINAERLRKFTWPIGEVDIAGHVSVGAHAINAFDWFHGSDQDSAANTFALCDDVKQPVPAVDEIDVRSGGRFEQVGCSPLVSKLTGFRVQKSPAVKRRVVLRVCFGLDHAPDASRPIDMAANKVPPQQVTCHPRRIAGKE